VGVTFTKQQQEAIFDDGHNLLVSASAGSGKTTVMIERILQLLLKYKDSENPLSISNFLVVTFTKASASDMKQKLINALQNMPQDEFILSQIEKVSTSDISNLHSFCSRLVQSYFYEVGVDPAVHIIDDIEATFLKNKALDNLFEQKEKIGDGDFFELFDIFQKKRSDKPLREVIKRFDDNLKENIDGEKWFFDSLENCFCDNLSKNVAAKMINNYAANLVQEFNEEIDNLLKESQKLGLEKLSDYLVDLSTNIRVVNYKNSFALNAKNVYSMKIKTAPKLPIEFEDIETRAKTLAGQIKKAFENLKANFVSDDETYLKFSLEKTKDTLLKLYELVKEFSSGYEKLKREVNGLDFHDLEHYALKILSNKDICESVKTQYRYVLVDEYQDINAIQEKIISLVSHNNNRFMVGDVKQSIYRFRFCDPDIFLEKFKLYEKNEGDNKLIKLNCNFRSDKKILKLVDAVFCGVMTDRFGEYNYQNNAIFVAGENNLDNKNAANLCFIDTGDKPDEEIEVSGVYSVKEHVQTIKHEQNKAIAEGALVASKIQDIMASRKDVSWQDFAVLVAARNENVDMFVKTLEGFEIPVAADKKYDLMKMQHICEIVNFVKLCVNKNDDFVLFKVLKSRIFNFFDGELARVRQTNKTDRFFDVFYNFDLLEENQAEQELCKKIAKFKFALEKFSGLAKLMNIKDFVQFFVHEFDIRLINMASENGRLKSKDIDDFLLALPNVDVFDYVNYYSDSPLIKESECGGNAVKVMTIHKSKGIEFKFVFLINLSNEFNFKSTYQNILFNKTLGVGMDCFDIMARTQLSSIPIAAIRMLEKRKLVEEQQRVLYVALTRAVEKLFVICSQNKKKISSKMKRHPTAFIDWFEPIISKELDGTHYEFLNFESYQIENLLDVPKKEKRQLLLSGDGEFQKTKWFEYFNDKAKDIPLKNSISKIIATSSDEETYDVNYFLEETNSSADRGTLYHKVMQQIDLKNLRSIDLQLTRIEENLTEEEMKIVDFKKIKNILKLEFFKDIQSDDLIFQEREFYAKMPAKIVNGNAGDDEFILQGVVDLAVIHGDELWILDYKTGRYSDAKYQKYKFQIEVYSEVFERMFSKKVTRKIICFIDEQKNIEF